MSDYHALSGIQTALRNGETSCRAIVGHYLDRITETRHLNAWIEVWDQEALEKADALDARLKADPGSLGRLFGAVISIKDNICYAGHQVTAASKILEGFTSVYSATAVERLLAEDAIIIGRTNCDQFGMGSSNENSIYGPVKNAADPTRVSGGSSGGAAVSVQTGACLAALGSDTGGSVRQPAAFCGLWGLKPGYGRISRHGLIAYGSSFDQIGVLARDPQDIATLLAVMEGPDDFDSTVDGRRWTVDGGRWTGDGWRETVDGGRETVSEPDKNLLLSVPEAHYPAVHRPPSPATRLPSTVSRLPSTVKIAYFPEATESAGMDTGVRSVTLDFMEKLRAAGHEMEGVAFTAPSREGEPDVPLLDYVVPTYYVLTTAEASSNLARYDGVRFGHRSPQARNLEETYLLTRTEGFSEEVKRRILLGTFVLSSGYYDAYYGKAQQARAMIRARIFDLFDRFDFILMPVAPDVAWRFGEKSADPVAMYLSDIYTVLANLAGIPALAVPAGLHPENGMPVGIQLMAGRGGEEKLLAFAATL